MIGGRLAGHRLGLVGAGVVLFLGLVAVAAPLVAPYPPFEMHLQDRFQAPSARYLFGTDEFGRDLLSRVIYGARISLAVGIGTMTLAGIVGVPLGLWAGYFGGAVDTVVMRLADCIFAFPAILVGVTTAAVLRPGSVPVMLAITIISIPVFARLARASVLAERAKLYVEAARSLGGGPGRILAFAVLPNCLPPLLVQATVSAAYAMLLEAGLSFLGLGAQPPEPSLGTMLNFARTYLNRAPWYGVFPGVVITALVLGLQFVADALRDAADPTQLRSNGEATDAG
jgi:peptide/nickel transport system permease protein